ncbi:MAG: hypothetical protein ACOC0P_04975, partial [Planctomycetota bacterium]
MSADRLLVGDAGIGHGLRSDALAAAASVCLTTSSNCTETRTAMTTSKSASADANASSASSADGATMPDPADASGYLEAVSNEYWKVASQLELGGGARAI